ncbi:MAG: tetratricopeptide repeat protein [Bacteroidetes bacterium]|nr:tetratricopeptide repeat protein [Bacteroidota bacterium]
MRLFLAILIIFTLYFPVAADIIARIDSLEDRLNIAADADKAEILNNLSVEYVGISLEKSKGYAANALRLAKKYHNIFQEGQAMKNLGKVCHYQKKYEQALDYYKQAYLLFEKNPDTEEMANMLYNIGYIHKGWGNYSKAVDYLERALIKYGEAGNLEELASTQRTIGITYFYWSKYNKAIEYYKMSLEIREKLGDVNGVASTLQTIGIVYHERNEYEEALDYYQQSLKKFEEIYEGSPQDTYARQGIANSLMNIGQVYKDWGQYKESVELKEKALEYIQQSLDIMNELDDRLGIAYAMNNIGLIYQYLNNYEKAIEFFTRALEIEEKESDKDGIAGTNRDIGITYTKSGEYDKALEYLDKAYTAYKQLDNSQGIAQCKLNIGHVHRLKKNYQTALSSYYQSLEIAERLGLRKVLEENYRSVSEVQKLNGDYRNALEYFEKFSNIKDSIFNVESSKQFSEMKEKYESEEKDKEIKLLNKEKELQDVKLGSQRRLIYTFIAGFIVIILFSIVLFRQVRLKNKANRQLEDTNRELEKLSIVASETDNAVLITDGNGMMEWVNEGFSRLYGYTLTEFIREIGDNIFDTSTNPQIRQIVEECTGKRTSAVYTSYCLNKLGKHIWLQTTLTPILSPEGKLLKLVAIDSDVTKIKEAEEEIKQQKQEITDSIHYASRIQNAILPPEEQLDKVVSEHFIINLPRDIVSGDFYWMAQADNKLILTVADCTGHGVPGAFMSILGVAFLNEIVNTSKELKASYILDKLRRYIIQSLHQTGTTGNSEQGIHSHKAVKDGMDMALCILDIKTKRLQFAGANNPLYLIKNFAPVLSEIKPDKMPIGLTYTGGDTLFNNNELALEKDDTFYLFSDGFVDQFGGPEGKKFKTRQFKQLLIEHKNRSLREQKEIILNSYRSWKGDFDQIDDILVMGIRV